MSHFGIGENCALLGYYAESSYIYLPTFRYNISVLYTSIKKTYRSHFERGPIGFLDP
jgi:hypothetical protein